MLTRATKRAGHLMGPENKPSETKGVLRWISDLCYTRSIDLKQSDSILPSGPVKTCTTDQGEFPTLPWTSEMRDDRMRRLDDWPIPLHTSHTPIHLPVDATEDLWSPGINFGVPLRTMEFVFEPIIYEEPPLPPPARNQPRQPDPPPLANRSARRQQPPSRGNQQPRPTKHKKGHR